MKGKKRIILSESGFGTLKMESILLQEGFEGSFCPQEYWLSPRNKNTPDEFILNSIEGKTIKFTAFHAGAYSVMFYKDGFDTGDEGEYHINMPIRWLEPHISARLFIKPDIPSILFFWPSDTSLKIQDIVKYIKPLCTKFGISADNLMIAMTDNTLVWFNDWNQDAPESDDYSAYLRKLHTDAALARQKKKETEAFRKTRAEKQAGELGGKTMAQWHAERYEEGLSRKGRLVR